MKVLIVGSSSREHALAWKIAQSNRVTRIFVAPGNAGCMAEPKTSLIDIQPDQIESLIIFAKKQGIDLVIPGSEISLLCGIVDKLQSVGIACLGPTLAAAQLGSSIQWTKSFLDRLGIPIAQRSPYIASNPKKPSTSSLQNTTKVSSHPSTADELTQTGLHSVLGFTALTDGYHILSLGFHKKFRFSIMHGKSMSTHSLAAHTLSQKHTHSLSENVIQTLIHPMIIAMLKEGIPYTGFLHIELELTHDQKFQVVKLQPCLDDIASQILLPRLNLDFISLVKSTFSARLDSLSFALDPRSSFALTLNSKGYPEAYETGKIIQFASSLIGLADPTCDPSMEEESHITSEPAISNAWHKVFHAGTRFDNGALVTNAGKVLGITTLDDNLLDARNEAYAIAEQIQWEDKSFCTALMQTPLFENIS